MLRDVQALTFAMGPVHRDSEGRRLRARLAERLGARLGIPVEVVSTASYAELATLMSDGSAQLGWMPPAIFARLEAGGLHLLAAVERSLGGYRGVLFAPADGAVKSLEDLRGKRVAWVDRDSCAGYLFVKLALQQAGLDPAELFASEHFEGSHGGVIRAVLRGDADVGATHAQTRPESDDVLLAGWHPYAGRDGMRALRVSPTIPPDVICAAPGLDPEQLDELRHALLSLHEGDVDDLLDELFGGARLIGAKTTSYDPVRVAMQG